MLGLLLIALVLSFVFAPGLRRPALAAMAFVALIALAPAAFAQGAAVTSGSPETLFHIPPLMWQEINEIMVGIFLAIGTMLWKWIDSHSPLKQTQAEEISRQAFQQLLLTGAKFGVSQLQAQEKKVGDIDVGNAAVAAGANFVISHGPDLAKKLGFDISTPEGQAAIIRSITARVSDLMPSNVPGTVGVPGGPTSIPLPSNLQPVAAPAGLPEPPPAPTQQSPANN